MGKTDQPWANITFTAEQMNDLIGALEAAIDCCGEEASIFRGMGSDKSVDCCLQQQKRYKALKFKIEKEKERVGT